MSLAHSFVALRSLLCSALLLSWLVLTASPVRAQPMGEVIVVPYGTPDLTAPLNVTSMLEAELSNERVSLIPLHDARDRFTARSRPPTTASDSDLDVLAREAREAIEHVAFGRTAAAQKSVREVIARAEKTLESLNRETATARHILDACLSLVRTALQSGRRDLALEQATRCRRLVPDLVPSETNHPANVVGVLAEADNMLRRMRIGHLTVRSIPESNCSVYLNGRHLGTTPFQLDRAAAGDYRVQVECSRSVGRVHVVQLGDQAVSLLVDTQFDRTVASDPRLLLRYENRERAREQAVSHAIQIGREVQADDVILVSVHNDRAELLRVQVEQQRLVARASVPWSARHGFSAPALQAAIAALAEGRFEGEPSLEKSASPPEQVELSTPPPAPPESEPVAKAAPAQQARKAPKVEPAPPEAEPEVDEAEPPAEPTDSHERASPARHERRVRGIGYGLLGASAVVLAIGVGFDVRTQHLLDRLSKLSIANSPGQPDDGSGPGPDSEVDPGIALELARLQPQYEHASHLRWIGVASGALATAAVGTLTRGRAHLPWWSYTLAAAGVGLVAAGGYEVSASGDCRLHDAEGQCRRPRETAARGATLISLAVPLLSVPLVQLIKPEQGRSLGLSSGPIYGGMQLQLRATY
ncbi:MAG: hypothetical protein JWN48_4995 [Myxococcaceae bacterium]|nr:hypothetical protein [Myxococcaceae bacterium]